MITLENINDRGLGYIAMAIDDIVRGEYEESTKGNGMYLKGTWLTPETCYWLLQLLKEAHPLYSSKETIERLQAGTNEGL